MNSNSKEMLKNILSRRGIGALLILFSLVVYTAQKNYEETLLEGGTGYSLTEALILLIFYYFFRSVQSDNIRSKIYALLPLILYYFLYEINFMQFGSVLTLNDFLLLPELIHVLLWYEIILLLVVLSIPFLLIGSNLRLQWGLKHTIYPVIIITCIGLSITASGAVGKQIRDNFPMQDFSHEHIVALYGPVSSAIIFEFERQYSLEKMLRYSSEEGLGSKRLLSNDSRGRNLTDVKRNLHLIVLESFIDVRKFSNLMLEEVINKKLNDSFFNHAAISIAPGFGNGTARSEFEMLCGLPSLQLFGSLEFSAFSGETTVDCLPSVLSGYGYKTIASHPFKPNYYNRIKAYKTLGFSDIKFGDLYSKVFGEITIDDAPGGWLYDGSLFEQNLKMLKPLLKKDQPIFNYVLTAYGHYPFKRDIEKRPIITMQDGVDDETNRLLNQIYYRVDEIHQYVSQLKELDPDGVVVLVGDHLPPLTNGYLKYEKLGYVSGKSEQSALNNNKRHGTVNKYHESLIVVLDKDSSVPLPDIHHFDIFQLILNRLSNSAYCKQNDCRYLKQNDDIDYGNDYFQLMKKAIS